MANTFVDQIREGMEVWSVDGHKLGKVVAIQADCFVIEKGVLFPKDYTLSADTIEEVRENAIVLSRRREELGIEKGILESLGFGGGQQERPEPLQAALRLEEAERAGEAARVALHTRETEQAEVEATEVPLRKTGT